MENADGKLAVPEKIGALKLSLAAVDFVARQSFRNCRRVTFTMQGLIHWFTANANALAVLAAVGVALLLVCCLECSNCSRREKDEIFHKREL